MFIKYPIILYTLFIICSSPIHIFRAVFWRFLHIFLSISSQISFILLTRYKKGDFVMNNLEMKKLYRRIERASRLRSHVFYRKLAALLCSLF